MIQNETTNFLLDLYERFGKDAQVVLDFVRKNEMSENVAPQTNLSAIFNSKDDILPNGVYIVCKNGDFYPFDENEKYKDVDFIGISHDGHTFGVPLHSELGEYALMESNKIHKDKHCVSEIEALLNWDFVGDTEYIQSIGTDIPLKDGQYLQTAPVWLAMYANMERLNAALKYYGGTLIKFKADRWFAKRYNVSNAWLFDGTSRYLYYDNVINTYQVGTVMLWNP